MEKKTPQTSAQKMAKRRAKLIPMFQQMGFMRLDKRTGKETPSQSVYETALIDAFCRGDRIVIILGNQHYTAQQMVHAYLPEYQEKGGVEK